VALILLPGRTAAAAKERSAMENKPAQNIQDSFLNTARKDKILITLYLLSGVKLTGRIRSFDKYSVVLETNNQEQLIFKHAISTVVMQKGHIIERLEPKPAEAKPAAGNAPAAASGPAGAPPATAGG
jgi:host factor-I protein